MESPAGPWDGACGKVPCAHTSAPFVPHLPCPSLLCSTHFCHPSAPQTWVLALFRALQQSQPLSGRVLAGTQLLSDEMGQA